MISHFEDFGGSEYYVPIKTGNVWKVKTPTGEITGILTEKRAELIGIAQEEQDRAEAESDSQSPIARAHRKYFAAVV